VSQKHVEATQEAQQLLWPAIANSNKHKIKVSLNNFELWRSCQSHTSRHRFSVFSIISHRRHDFSPYHVWPIPSHHRHVVHGGGEREWVRHGRERSHDGDERWWKRRKNDAERYVTDMTFIIRNCSVKLWSYACLNSQLQVTRSCWASCVTSTCFCDTWRFRMATKNYFRRVAPNIVNVSECHQILF